MLAEPVHQELSRRAVAQRGVAAPPVVEDGNVLEQIGLGVGPCRVTRAMHPLVLQGRIRLPVAASPKWGVGIALFRLRDPACRIKGYVFVAPRVT